MNFTDTAEVGALSEAALSHPPERQGCENAGSALAPIRTMQTQPHVGLVAHPAKCVHTTAFMWKHVILLEHGSLILYLSGSDVEGILFSPSLLFT